jgi:cytidylate kinase
MLVTITGKLGSGKSTICAILSDRCNYEIYSTGVIHRNLAKQMGLDTLALNKLMSSNSSYDLSIEKEVKRIASERSGDRLIFDSRLAWHFIDDSLKIFTTVDPVVAADRVLKSPRGEEEQYHNLANAVENLKLRSNLERERFQEIYGVDYLDYNNFDLILDTTWLAPALLVTLIIVECLHPNKPPTNYKPTILISPKSLYPTQEIGLNRPLTEDNFRSDPIKIICQDGYHYVVGDHSQFGTALSLSLPYVYASLADSSMTNQLVLAPGSLDSKLLSEPQILGEFTYASLPETYRDYKNL